MFFYMVLSRRPGNQIFRTVISCERDKFQNMVINGKKNRIRLAAPWAMSPLVALASSTSPPDGSAGGAGRTWRHFMSVADERSFPSVGIHVSVFVTFFLTPSVLYSISRLIVNVIHTGSTQSSSSSSFTRCVLTQHGRRWWAVAEPPPPPLSNLVRRFSHRCGLRPYLSQMAANNYFGFTHGGTQYAWVLIVFSVNAVGFSIVDRWSRCF